jgi:predicted O-methyltransferase YrrM
MGGGGDYGLLYFLVRWRRPAVVVETGVAAGYSSQAFLAALDANGAGHLWSSDFPYVRSTAAREAIGCVVEPRVRERWTLRLDGDVANLRGILSEIDAIDLFHYDSDKSWTGRERTMAAVLPRLRADAWWIMDDIQDNAWFARWARARPDRVRVFEFGGKYLGLVAPVTTAARGAVGA